jgi:Family of unknown function (DUF5681)
MSDHEVGYRKPPQKSRFKKGVSGNPKGRPKRKPFAAGDIVNKVLNSSAEYRERGQTKRASRRELTLRNYVRLALKGDAKAAETLLRLRAHAQRFGDVGNDRVEVTSWLPDHRGQTGAQKTLEFAARVKASHPSGGSPPMLTRSKIAIKPTWAQRLLANPRT